MRSVNNAAAQRRRSSAKSTTWIRLTDPERGELIVHLWDFQHAVREKKVSCLPFIAEIAVRR